MELDRQLKNLKKKEELVSNKISKIDHSVLKTLYENLHIIEKYDKSLNLDIVRQKIQKDISREELAKQQLYNNLKNIRDEEKRIRALNNLKRYNIVSEPSDGINGLDIILDPLFKKFISNKEHISKSKDILKKRYSVGFHPKYSGIYLEEMGGEYEKKRFISYKNKEDSTTYTLFYTVSDGGYNEREQNIYHPEAEELKDKSPNLPDILKLINQILE